MSTSKPRKPRKRAREIREHARAAGAQYTATLRENDRSRRPSPPAGVEPWEEPSTVLVRQLAGFVRERCEETADAFKDPRLHRVLGQLVPKLAEDDLSACERFFRHAATIATAAENLLLDALIPGSVYGALDDEDPPTPEEIQGCWHSLLDLAHPYRAHSDLPDEVYDTVARWTPRTADPVQAQAQ